MYLNRHLHYVLFIVFFCVINSRLQSEPFRPLPETQGQLFSKEIEAKLPELDFEHRIAIWPNAEEMKEKLPLDSISSGVIQESVKWMRKILKSGWIPEEIENHFIAFRREMPFIPPHEVDCLIVRYEMKDQRIQIFEIDGYISILIDPMTEKDSQSSITDYITKGAKEYLNLPEERIVSIKTDLKTVELDGSRILHFGKVYFEDKNKDSERTWWHRISVWSDGRLMYFETVERNGQPVPHDERVNFGIPPRF